MITSRAQQARPPLMREIRLTLLICRTCLVSADRCDCFLVMGTTPTALFLKYDNKRDGDDGEGTWEVVPRSTAWLDG